MDIMSVIANKGAIIQSSVAPEACERMSPSAPELMDRQEEANHHESSAHHRAREEHE